MLRIPNALMDFPLSPNALKVFVYLLSCAGKSRTAVVRVCRIAERCHICANTVRSAVAELGAVGLLEKSNRYNQQHQYIANSYALADVGGRWFELNTAQDVFAVSGSSFMVYLYLLRCRGHNGKAFPSLRRMEAALGLCRAVVVKAIRLLSELGLIVKAALRAGKHNLYRVLRAFFLGADTKKESTACTPCFLNKDKKASRKPICKAIIPPLAGFVKHIGEIATSLWSRVVYFLSNKALTHPLYDTEKEIDRS